MPQDCGPSDYAELIEASIQWGKASDIVHILIDWLEVRLTSRGKEPDIKEKVYDMDKHVKYFTCDS